VAIVTGGSGGIGRATIDRLASRGYAVVVNYLHDQRAAEATVDAVAGRIDSTPVAETGLEEFDALYRINTRATLIVDREAARLVRNGGAIVNLSSSAAGSALSAHGVYVASRAATDVLTRALAVELGARDITVNAVSLAAGGPCLPERVADAGERQPRRA
jgi:3-oxoacyl-[acyl-carrier protein] reductase